MNMVVTLGDIVGLTAVGLFALLLLLCYVVDRLDSWLERRRRRRNRS